MGCSSVTLLIFRGLELLFSLIVLAGTSDIIHKFSEARQLIDDSQLLDPTLTKLIDDHILATPVRIYLGMSVSIWTVLTTFYLIIVSRIRNGKFAPRALIISLEIFTIIFWFWAFIAVALFAAEVEPLCLAADRIPIIKKAIENCIITKVVAAFAAFSWVIWCITCIMESVQGCRARKNKKRASFAANAYGTGNRGYELVETAGVAKAEQGVEVTTVEMGTR